MANVLTSIVLTLLWEAETYKGSLSVVHRAASDPELRNAARVERQLHDKNFHPSKT